MSSHLQLPLPAVYTDHILLLSLLIVCHLAHCGCRIWHLISIHQDTGPAPHLVNAVPVHHVPTACRSPACRMLTIKQSFCDLRGFNVCVSAHLLRRLQARPFRRRWSRQRRARQQHRPHHRCRACHSPLLERPNRRTPQRVCTTVPCPPPRLASNLGKYFGSACCLQVLGGRAVLMRVHSVAGTGCQQRWWEQLLLLRLSGASQPRCQPRRT